MIAIFSCQTCGEKGEIQVSGVDLLNGEAEELCPSCASVIMQKTGEISLKGKD